MENYRHFYYALFNSISDLLSQIEENPCNPEQFADLLKKLQLDAETRFLEDSENHKMSWEECTEQQYIILNNGLMGLFIDSEEEYQKSPEAAQLMQELHEIMDEADKIHSVYLKDHKNEFKFIS